MSTYKSAIANMIEKDRHLAILPQDSDTASMLDARPGSTNFAVGGAGAGDIETKPTADELKADVTAFLSGWTAALAKGWDSGAAATLHDDLEQIASSADLTGDRAIADAAIELTVFLCSFVEQGKAPRDAHRQRLDRLVEALSAAATFKATAAAVQESKASAAIVHRSVVYLRPASAELNQLATLLGQHRYLVRPFEEVEEAIASILDQAPDALVLHDSFVPQLHLMMRAVERGEGGALGSCACLVLAAGENVATRLAAQRAGASLVLANAEAGVVVDRLDQLLLTEARRSYRVMVVDDDRSQSLFCDVVLRHKGMTTRLVKDAPEALLAAYEFRPDLVLMDLHLPGMNGIEATQLLRERPDMASVPIIFLSGEHDLQQRFDAIRLGGDDFLIKPIKPRHLIGAVTSRVRRARALMAESAHARAPEGGAVLASRETFAQALVRASQESGPGAAAIFRLAVDDAGKVASQIGYSAVESLARQISVALSADPSLNGPVCADGELAFLLLIRAASFGSLHAAAASLRSRLVSRGWLYPERPLHLSFCAFGLSVIGAQSTVDEMIVGVRSRCAELQAAGGAQLVLDKGQDGSAPEEPAEFRLARAILRGQFLADRFQVRYQPILPLRGQMIGMYRMHLSLIAPKTSRPLTIGPEVYLPVARVLDAVKRLDRWLVAAAIGVAKQCSAAGQEVRLYVPLNPESLLDPEFAAWLGEELRGQQIPGAAIALQLDAPALMRERAYLGKFLEDLQKIGVRLCLASVEADPNMQRLARHLSLDAIKTAVRMASDGLRIAPETANVIREAISDGKLVVATDISDPRQLAGLLHLGAHYAEGDCLAPVGLRPDFDFSDSIG